MNLDDLDVLTSDEDRPPGTATVPRSDEREPAAPRRRRLRPPLDVALLVVVLAAVLAVSVQRGPAWIGPDWLGLDSAKLSFTGRVLGIPHTPGYPLYVVLTWAWTALPVASIATLTNAFSAVAGLAAAVLLRQCQTALGVRPWIATAMGAALVFTPQFWGQSLIAEVYTLHLALLLGVLWAALRWANGAPDRWLLGAWCVWCLGLGNHLTIGLLLPSLVLLVVTSGRRVLTPRRLLLGAAVLAVGAAQYLFLFWRTAAHGVYLEFPVRTLGDLWWVVTGGPFHGQMLAFSPAELLTTRLALVGEVLWRDLGLLLVPAAWGVLRLQGRLRAALVLYGVLSVLYAMSYDIPDIDVYFLPVEAVLLLFAGVGFHDVVSRLATRVPATVAVAGVVLVPVVLGLDTVPRQELRTSTVGGVAVRHILDAVGSDAILVSQDYVQSSLLRYYLIGEGLAAERNIWLAWQADAEDVEAYLRDGTSLHAELGTFRDPRRPGMLPDPEPPPPGLPVYAVDAHQALLLRIHGLRVLHDFETADLWRVTLRP